MTFMVLDCKMYVLITISLQARKTIWIYFSPINSLCIITCSYLTSIAVCQHVG